MKYHLESSQDGMKEKYVKQPTLDFDYFLSQKKIEKAINKLKTRWEKKLRFAWQHADKAGYSVGFDNSKVKPAQLDDDTERYS